MSTTEHNVRQKVYHAPTAKTGRLESHVQISDPNNPKPHTTPEPFGFNADIIDAMINEQVGDQQQYVKVSIYLCNHYEFPRFFVFISIISCFSVRYRERRPYAQAYLGIITFQAGMGAIAMSSLTIDIIVFFLDDPALCRFSVRELNQVRLA